MSSGTAAAKQCYGKCVFKKGIQWQAQKCMPVPCWSGINLTECKVIGLCKVEKVDLGNPQKLEKLEKLSDQMGVKASVWVWTLFRSAADPLFYFQGFWQLNCWRCKCGGAYAMAADFVVFKMVQPQLHQLFQNFHQLPELGPKIVSFFFNFFQFPEMWLNLQQLFSFFSLSWNWMSFVAFSTSWNEANFFWKIFRDPGGTTIKFWTNQLLPWMFGNFPESRRNNDKILEKTIGLFKRVGPPLPDLLSPIF